MKCTIRSSDQNAKNKIVKCCLIFAMCSMKWKIVDCFIFPNKYAMLNLKAVHNMNDKYLCYWKD